MPSPRSVAIDTRRAHDAEGERLHEDAAEQVLAVVAAGDGDHAAEDEREQQHEHDRLQRDVEQLLGDLADVLRGCGRASARLSATTSAARGRGESTERVAASRRPPCGRVVRERKTSSSVASRRWTSVGVDAGGVERADDLDERACRRASGTVDDGAPRRSTRAPSANGASAAAAASSSLGVGDRDVDPLAADARLQLGRRARGGDAAVVEHDDVVGEAVGLLEVLGREHSVVAVADELAQQLPEVVAARAGRGRSSARRGTAPAARRRALAARSSRRRMPPENVLTSRSRGVGEAEPLEQLVGALRARRRAAGGRGAPTSSRFARAVSRPSTVAACPASPMRARTRGGVGDHVVPGDRALPVGGRASVVRIRIAVVLPAPLWPSRPSTVPAGTSRSRSRSAQRSPKRLPRPSARTPCAVVVRCTAFVHHTNSLAVRLYEVSSATSATSRRSGRGPRPGARKPALHARADRRGRAAIADAEGFEAVSMRRVADELGAGTMTLYHYVDEQGRAASALMDDAMMGELLVPDDELADDWRDGDGGDRAPHARARSCATRGSFDFIGGEDDPGVGGPNALRHFEQSLAVAERTGLDLTGQFEIIALVDDFVFGHAMRVRGIGRLGSAPERERLDAVVAYMERQLATGEFPRLQAIAGDDLVGGFQRVAESRPIPSGSSAGSRSCSTGSR